MKKETASNFDELIGEIKNEIFLEIDSFYEEEKFKKNGK